MKYAYSEVFENYAKIAADQGLVKEAEEKNPRYDSNDLSAIQVLYGIKPNGDEDILDQAHPTPVVIAPAHDKVNGLVENLKERQDIMAGIALKQNRGVLTNNIYAKASDDLLMEVVKIGFILDRDGEEQLMMLADHCAEKLADHSENMIKVAWTWKELGSVLGIGGGVAAGVALSLGPVGWGVMGAGLIIAGLINHFGGMVDQGVIKDCDRAIAELQDVVNENDSDMSHAFGQIQQMIKNISYVKNLGNKAASSSLSPATATPENINEFKQLIEDYKKACSTLAEYIPSYVQLLTATSSMRGGERSSDLVSVVKKVWQIVYPDEIKDAVTALETLQSSLASSAQVIDQYSNSMKSYLDKNKSDIVGSIEELSKKHEAHRPPADHWHNEGNTPDTSKDIESAIQQQHEKK